MYLVCILSTHLPSVLIQRVHTAGAAVPAAVAAIVAERSLSFGRLFLGSDGAAHEALHSLAHGLVEELLCLSLVHAELPCRNEQLSQQLSNDTTWIRNSKYDKQSE